MREIPVAGGLVAIVDDEDFALVSPFRWEPAVCLSKSNGRLLGYYAKSERMINGKRSRYLMHRLILGAKPGQLVDHKDRNRLNNVRSNLRFCTYGQNTANSERRSASGYRGVRKAGHGLWQARINAHGGYEYLGKYPTLIEAAIAYDEAALKAFGEYATLNFPAGVSV